MTMQIHLSSGEKSARGTDVMTAWFAKGVGLVKYVERQELSAVKEDGCFSDSPKTFKQKNPAVR